MTPAPWSHAAIPVIDIGGLTSAEPARRKDVAWQIHRACRDTGFFYAADHGIPQSLLEGQFAAARAFFALPEAAKMAVQFRPGAHNRGYEALRRQRLDAQAPPDLKESFMFAGETPDGPPNQWPEGLPGFRAQMEAYQGAVTSLADRLIRAVALSLDLSESYFSDGFVAVKPSIRLLHYPPQPKDAALDQLGAGAHTDWGALTLLLQDDAGGLEVCNAEGQWIAARPIPGTLVVNLGDMVRRWTNDLYQSTRHRVRSSASGRSRYACAAFYSPRRDYVVRCVPTCLPEAGPPHYAPCTTGEHMDEMVRRTYGG
ncbi:isopenicillin N synthase family dioxygenase [Falsiroseomonas selenitidurans]|uniref:Isopenicillin N synthase family oxygenase n=1 Tax=Falsiroseomonas selenitidurans TaxID=2716335 RepID=A0ABX1E5W8_9PROT|nr:isopenicillin N synthase family oxygenase [Falsiroseomonas selenitidurans]NKC32564.1 isopenicillin N synthase family oxygenase [Falsiroseomonas selenitidurans]